MPQLPSGRHIGIRLEPLDDLINNAGNPGNVHRVMAITDIKGLAPYVEILFLVPDMDENGSPSQVVFTEGSLPRPPGLTVISSGHTLAQLSELTSEWIDDDKRFFQDFLETRCQEMFAAGLRDVQKAQQWLLKESGMTARQLALWYRAGCHPCQEDGWNESQSSSTDYDTYDMLAALGQLSILLPQRPDIVERLGFAHDRLQGVWASFRDHFAIPDGWPSVDMNVRTCAEIARAMNWFSSVPEERLRWAHGQCAIECVNLWNASGDKFQKEFPDQCGIIDLVVVSGGDCSYSTAE